jgi:hypothetical protein
MGAPFRPFLESFPFQVESWPPCPRKHHRDVSPFPDSRHVSGRVTDGRYPSACSRNSEPRFSPPMEMPAPA